MGKKLSPQEKVVSGLLYVLLLVVIFLATWSDRPIPGDVDGNRKINQTDLYLIAGYVAKRCELDPDQIKAADVNSDGRVNSMDITIIAKQIEKEEQK